MAPYGGPTLAQLIPLLRAGLKDSVALGFGIPKATLANDHGTFELRGLSGGEGFGVQPDLVNPFVDTGVLVRATRWQDVMAWLCEHWPADWGDALHKGEQLRITFSGADPKTLAIALHAELDVGIADAMTTANAGAVASKLAVAASVCRAARTAGATLDFEAVQRK